MISAKPMAMVAMFALAGGTFAQEKADEQRIAELIEQLGAEDPRDRDQAMHQLVVLGSPAAEELVNEVKRGNVSTAVFRTLRETGPLDVDAIETLILAMPESPDSALPALYECLYFQILFLPVEGARTSYWNRVRTNNMARLRAAYETRSGTITEDLAHVVRLGREYQNPGTPESTVRVEDDVNRLIQVLEAEDWSNRHAKELAAELLGMRGSTAAAALPALVELLRSPNLQEGSRTSFNGEFEVRYEYGPRTHNRVAETILRISPSGEEAAEAHAYLVQHGDSYKRRVSLDSLRGFGETAAIATESLSRVAADPDEEALFRYEVITTLGLIGPAARDAIPTLEKLTEHDDPQIAERAKAALRQVRDGRQG